MFEQILYYVAYVLALSLQLSAGLLLVGNTNITRKGIIREYCARHTAIAFDEKGNLVDSSNLKEVAKSTWLNYIAFIYLFVGYLVSVFGEPLPNKWLSFAVILGLTLIIFVITFNLAKMKSKNFKVICKDDLELKGGVAFCIVDSDEEDN